MEVNKIRFDCEFIYVESKDNKTGKMPLIWFPRLLNAKKSLLDKYELWADSSWIHKEELGEDLSFEGFLILGRKLLGTWNKPLGLQAKYYLYHQA